MRSPCQRWGLEPVESVDTKKSYFDSVKVNGESLLVRMYLRYLLLYLVYS